MPGRPCPGAAFATLATRFPPVREPAAGLPGVDFVACGLVLAAPGIVLKRQSCYT